MHIRISVLALFIVATLPVFACAQSSNFTSPVAASMPAQQSNARARFDEAVAQATAQSKDARFWVVYSINARQGIGIDEELPRELKEGNLVLKEGLRISMRPASPSKNVGVFLLHRGNEIERVEVHDLDRFRSEDKYPVKSLGPIQNSESIALLKSLLAKHSGALTGERLVLAIALHEDPQVETILLDIINTARADEKQRGTAAMWLGQIPGQKATLENLARNKDLPVEVRKQAVVGLGFSRYTGVLSTLQNLYETLSDREVKEQTLFAASNTVNRTEAAAFLNKVKSSDSDPDFRQQAGLWLERLSQSQKL